MTRILGSLILTLALTHAATAEDKSLAKSLIGKWSITKTINGKVSSQKSTIEFRDDGTYRWKHIGPAKEGKYKLKGKDLFLAFNAKTSIIWKNLELKNGKIHRKQSVLIVEEWTRVDE